MLHPCFHLHGTLTKIMVHLHAQWEPVSLLSAVFHYCTCSPLAQQHTQVRHTQALGEIQKFSANSTKFAMQHLTLEGFIRSRADVRTEFYEQLKRRQLAASRIVRSRNYRQYAFCLTSRTMETVEVYRSKQPEETCGLYQITVRINHSDRMIDAFLIS